MALAMIKYDANNRPKHAKYRIVVLGNLDYHNWSKESTAAPVMSQLELHLLTSLATSHQHVLKNCDVKQAFVHLSLPEDEIYFVKPLVGCHRSPPGTIWRLTRSLFRTTTMMMMMILSAATMMRMWSRAMRRANTPLRKMALKVQLTL
jgi:hypothetical protein